MASVVGVIISLTLLGGAFLMISKDSATTLGPFEFKTCQYKNCDACVTDDKCGFCSVKDQRANGYCEPVADTDGDKNSKMGGRCSNPTGNEYHPSSTNTSVIYEFADVYCHTSWTFVPIILMVVYLFCFSSGYAPAPWVLNSEFYPLWARSTCISIATFVNWTLNLIVSLTFLTLTQAVTKAGKFWCNESSGAPSRNLQLTVFWFGAPKTAPITRMLKIHNF